LDQETSAARSTNKLDAGVLIFILLFALVGEGFVYWGMHFPIDHPHMVRVWAVIIYFGLSAAIGIWILVRCIQRRIHKSPFLIIAAIILFTFRWTSVETYPHFAQSVHWLRFQKNQQFYRETVASTDPSTIHIFKWGEGQLFPGSKHFRYLIFDNNRGGKPGERLGALSTAITHPEPVGGALDTSRLASSSCSRSGRRLTDGFLVVSVSCPD
jgi:hypothetical protein